MLANYHRGLRRRQRLGGRLRDTLARDVEPDPANGVADWDGLTPAEAAGVIGIAPGTARMRLARARQRFRDLVEPGGDAPAPTGHVQAVPFEHVIGEGR